MDVKPNTILDGDLEIISTIAKYNNYFVYSAFNNQTGTIFHITEYFPEESVRDDNGTVIISYETIKPFDIWVNNFTSDADIASLLKINDYLHIAKSFSQTGTGYVVTDEISGVTFKEFLKKKNSPLTIDEATPVYLEFLDAVTYAASEHEIYFYINPSTIYVTKDGNIRMHYLYAKEYDEKTATADIANLYYFLLFGYMPADFTDKNTMPDFPKEHSSLIDFIAKQCKEENYHSMRAFHTDLTKLYLNAKKEIPENEKDPSPNTRFGIIALSVVIGLIIILSITSFFVTKLIIGDPFSQENENSIEGKDEIIFAEPFTLDTNSILTYSVRSK